MKDNNFKIDPETLLRQMEFILGATKTGMDIIDSDYNIRYIDPQWAKVYGDLAGKKCYEYFMGRKELCPGCGVTKALETKKPVVTEETLVREGNRRVQITTIPFQGEKGEWLVGEINIDVTERKKTEEEQKRLIAIIEATPDFVGFADANDTHIIYINKAGRKMCGIDKDADVTKLKIRDVHPEWVNKMLAEKILPDAARDGIWIGESAFLDIRDRREIPVSMVLSSHKAANGEVAVFSTISRDITERKRAERELEGYRQNLEELVKERTTELNRINEQLRKEIAGRKLTEDTLFYTNQTLQDIINFLPDATFVIDKDRKVIAWNRAIETMTGVKQIDMLGKGDYAYAVPFYGKLRPILIDIVLRPDKKIEAKYDFITRVEHVLYAEVYITATHQGKGAYVWCVASPLFDIKGNIVGAIESLRDITGSKHAEEKLKVLNREIAKTNRQLKQLSLRDSHTGLYNHRYFMEAIEVEFERARRNGQPLSTMMLDIDYFKSINDVYGHQFGDLILKQFAKQLIRLVRRYDVVIRYGGEEFIIISPGTSRVDALNLARRILDALNLYNFGDKAHIIKLKLSIAIASYPNDNVINGMDLMGLTDQILNRVKDAGGNRVYSSLDIGRKKALSLKESTDVKFMEGKIERLTKRANQSLVEAIFAFAKTIELKDRYTGEHGERTVQFATDIARQLSLSRYDIELIRQAAMLHDLGKIGISEVILLKKGKLTKEEFREIKKHPQIAADILRPIQFLHPLIPLILHHHERWDGKGYPHGLKGRQIPMGACVIALADHYQALISDRPYRKAFLEKEAVKIIRRGSGTQFCPKVVTAFLKILKKK